MIWDWGLSQIKYSYEGIKQTKNLTNFNKYFNLLTLFYLGVHSILDVIGGVILAIVVLIIMNKVFDKLEENPNLDIIISVVGLILLAIVTVITLTKSYPIDYDSAGKIIVEPIKNLLISFKI